MNCSLAMMPVFILMVCLFHNWQQWVSVTTKCDQTLLRSVRVKRIAYINIYLTWKIAKNEPKGQTIFFEPASVVWD